MQYKRILIALSVLSASLLVAYGAGEIKARAQLDMTYGNLSVSEIPPQVTVDLVTTNSPAIARGVQSIGLTAEAIALGDVGTEGYAIYRNIETNNTIRLGIDDGGDFHSFAELDAGEVALFRISTNAVKAISVTGTNRLQYLILPE